MLGPLSAALPPAGLGLLVAVLAAAACHYGAVREVAALATVAAG
jgi:hypothetical protein